jgi:adenylosuccinate lyase
MIDRYSNIKMKEIWSDDFKFNTWLKVELAVLKVYSDKFIIPKDDYLKILDNAKVDVVRIKELEDKFHHDVIAFTRQVSETLGEEKKWVHYGLTSTDVVDTANAVVLKAANIEIENELLNLIEVLKEKALIHKDTPCIGRTHGIHGEVTSFGLKWALYYDEASRNLKRFRDARSEIERGKFSGAVGNFANLDPIIEVEACKYLGIANATISTQVISRDFHINYLNSIALIASMLEKIATEVRHLSRTEVREVEEFFDINQKGSSAMPHKRNPISSENICGLSRVVRSFVTAAYDNNILWHERDISHSSAERIILADATTLIHYMLRRYTNTIKKLTVFPERMLINIKKTNNVIFSGRVVSMLIDKGHSREFSYDLVQKHAIKSYNEDLDFKELMLKSEVTNYASSDEINSCFNYEYYLRNVTQIFNRLNLGGNI